MDSHVITIVVNWRLKEETVQCVRSLQALDHPTTIIVVDNASGDGSAAYIRQHCPAVHLLEQSENLGFGRACNLAFAYAIAHFACDYVFLVNNDVTLAPDALRHLLEVAGAYPNAAVLGAKVYYDEGNRRLWHAGARRRKGVLAAADSGRNELDNGQYDERESVDYIFGATMLIRRSAIDQLGFFDERFFLYLEDLDFCLRVQKAGLGVRFVPKAHAWHEGSASTRSNLALRRYHMAKSSIVFMRKHARKRTALFIFLFWVLVYTRDIVVDLVRHDWQIVTAAYRGLVAGTRDDSADDYVRESG